jgi:hypothetical protein
LRLGAVQRQVALAGAALLAAVVALAITAHHDRASSLPPAVGSYTALAASSGSIENGHVTACGQIVGPATEGVIEPVLPCGVKLYIGFEGKHVLAEVIDHGNENSTHEFELTQALAARLGLVGVQRITWSYAGAQ